MEKNKMIKKEDIIIALRKRGYEVETYTGIKNGVTLDGIRFISKNGVCPVIYTDDIIKYSNSLQDVIDNILDIYNRTGTISFDKDKFMDTDFVLENLYIGLQKTSNENIVKDRTDFEGIEKYLYVKINDDLTFKLTCKLMNLGISESETWKIAEKNTFAETKIETMFEMLTGQEHDEEDNDLSLYVVTNNNKFRGASAILDKIALEKLAYKLNVNRFIVLPSSIHEMIVVPLDNESYNIEDFNKMVKEINEMEVKPEERLTDRAYIMGHWESR